MKEVINQFFKKTHIENKEEYDFLVVKENFIIWDFTVEENGITGKNEYILVKKFDINKKHEFHGEVASNLRKMLIKDELIPKIHGDPVILMFVLKTGNRINIPIGSNNTFRDAAILFFKKVNIDDISLIENIFFLYKAKKLDINDNKTLEEIGITKFAQIWVIEAHHCI